MNLNYFQNNKIEILLIILDIIIIIFEIVSSMIVLFYDL